MINQQGTFTGHGKTDLFYQSWLPDQNMQAALIIIHGGGDHSGRFENVVNAVVPDGFGIYMFDLRGHGKSPGKRGHINSWQEYRDDLSAFVELVRPMNPEVPLFLFGHSMGAIIALDYCIRHQPDFAGVICTSPAIGKLGIPPFLFRLAKVLDKTWPSLVLPNRLVVPHLSRDADFIKRTQADPLYHTLSSPRFGMEMLKTIDFVHANASSFKLPFYLIHGQDDKIASIEGSRRFKANLSHPDVIFKTYEGGYHELFNDLDKETVLNDLKEWLHLKSRSGIG